MENSDTKEAIRALLGNPEPKPPTALEILMNPEAIVKSEQQSLTTDVVMPEFVYQTYMVDNKGVKREDMPQIDAESIDDFIIHYAKKATVRKVLKRLSDLKPTQSEINEDKVLERVQNASEYWKTRRYIISSDGYLLDGHHDWAYGLELDPNAKVHVYKVSLPIDELVSRTNRMKIAKKVDINGLEIQKALDVMAYVLKHPNEFSPDIVEKAKHYEFVQVHGKDKVFQRKQLVGFDEEPTAPKETPKVAEEKTKKPKKIHWFSEINTKHKLSKLPIGIPKEHVTVDLSGDIDTHAVLKWNDPKTGREQRSYTQVFMQRNAQKKYKRISQLDFDIDEKIIDRVNKNLKNVASTRDQSYAILGIIAHTGLRPGSRALYRQTKNRGISTLGPDNVIVRGNNIVLNFVGKSYHENNSSFKNPKLAKFLEELKTKNKGKEFLFDVATTKGADYILKKDIGLEGVKLKDLRTFQAAKLATNFLHSSEMAPPPVPESGVKQLLQKKLQKVFEIVSNKLNNSPAMAKKSYVPPSIIMDWIHELGLEKTALIKAIGEDRDRPSDAWSRLKEYHQGVDVGDTTEDPVDEYGEEDDVQFDLPLAILRILG